VRTRSVGCPYRLSTEIDAIRSTAH